MDMVRRWMTSPAIVVRDGATLPEARQLMADHRIRRLPVVDAYGELVGIVTEGDINRISDSHETDVREYNMYYHAGDLPIRNVMHCPVVTVDPDMPLSLVARLLQLYRIGGVPVVEAGQIVGVITENDLFRFILASERATEATAVEAE